MPTTSAATIPTTGRGAAGAADAADAARAAFARDGYLLVPGLLAPESVAGMRTAFERVSDVLCRQLVAEGAIADAHAELGVERRLAVAAAPHMHRFGRSWRRLVAGPEVFRLHHDPALVELVGRLIGGDVIGHSVFNARPKLPDQEITVVPWHQDSGYFGAASAQSLILTCWVPVVTVDEANGCLQVVPGSHHGGLRAHRVEDRPGRFLEIVDGDPPAGDVVTCAMQPGDVLVLHNLCWHRSLANRSDGIRWSIDVRFLRDGDDGGASYAKDFPAPWVIRSATRPAVGEAAWRSWCAALPW